MRPTTARRRPPKVKENVQETSKQDQPVKSLVLMKDGDDGGMSDEDEGHDDAMAAKEAAAASLAAGEQHSKLVEDIMRDQEKVGS